MDRTKPKATPKATVAQGSQASGSNGQDESKGLPIRRRSQRQEPRRFRSQRSRFQQIRVVKVDSSQRLVTRKEKAKVKVRRTHKISLRQIQRIVPRRQFLVSSGQRAHATGGESMSVSSRGSKGQACSEAKGGCIGKCKGDGCSGVCNG